MPTTSDRSRRIRVADLHPRLLAFVRQGLHDTVQDPSGTGYKTVRLEEVAISGKTGTAETGAGKADHAWFAGYVPSDKPQVAFVVILGTWRKRQQSRRSPCPRTRSPNVKRAIDNTMRRKRSDIGLCRFGLLALPGSVNAPGSNGASVRAYDRFQQPFQNDSERGLPKMRLSPEPALAGEVRRRHHW